MPKYDYTCPANGQTVEAEHSWSKTLATWGDLCAAAGIEPGDTPLDSPVERLIGQPRILRSQYLQEQAAVEQAARPKPSGMHPIGCPCCDPPDGPGIAAFQEKLRAMARKRESQ